MAYKMEDKCNDFFILPEELKNKIKNDNDFNLRLCLHVKCTQTALNKQVKRNSKTLFLPNYIEFYKANGFEKFFT
ncbi:hypothetical protein D1Z98_01675 [Riemerella anatipestifer]|nr:hypothetical protein [Riemerella anatipestifer]